MSDPFRERSWPAPWILILFMLLGIAGMVALVDWQHGNLRAQKPEIIYGTFTGAGPVIQRRFGPSSHRMFVRLEDGSTRSFGFAFRNTKGCAIGSKVAIERRGLNLTLAQQACPAGEADKK